MAENGVKAVSQLLEIRRVELGLTRDALRASLKIGPNQLADVLDGRWENLKWSTITKVATGLGVGEQDLFGGRESGALGRIESMLKELVNTPRQATASAPIIPAAAGEKNIERGEQAALDDALEHAKDTAPVRRRSKKGGP